MVKKSVALRPRRQLCIPLLSHLECLPIGLSARSSGIEFLPDIPEEAAPGVAKALTHVFVNRFGGQVSQAIAPWNLTEEDKNLAAAVGDEFKKLGVGYEALRKVDVSTKGVNDRTQEVFRQNFTALKKATGFEDNIGVFILTPMSIIFPPPLLGVFEVISKAISGVEVCGGIAEVPATY